MKYFMLSLFSALALGSGAVRADSYEVVNSSTTDVTAKLKKTVTTIQVVTEGPGNTEVRNPLNRFSVTRVRRKSHNLKGPVLLRSPFNFDVRFYELTKNNAGNYSSTFLANVAEKKLDVWVVDDRINYYPPGSCETAVVDCSIMSTWNISTKIQDIEYVRGLIAQEWTAEKPVIGGFVGGAIDAMAAVNANPSGYAGLFAWEGSLYSADQAVQNYNAPFCAQAQAAFGAGFYYDPSAVLLKTLLLSAASNPNDPAPPLPIPGIPAGLTNQQLLFLILTTHIDNPSFPTPWWITTAGSAIPSSLTYAEEDQLYQLGPVANSYAAVATAMDYACGFAGDRTHNNNLSSFEGHVLMQGGSLAMGPLLEDTAGLFTNAASVEVMVMPGFGEQDTILNKHRKSLIDGPFANWAIDVLN